MRCRHDGNDLLVYVTDQASLVAMPEVDLGQYSSQQAFPDIPDMAKSCLSWLSLDQLSKRCEVVILVIGKAFAQLRVEASFLLHPERLN